MTETKQVQFNIKEVNVVNEPNKKYLVRMKFEKQELSTPQRQGNLLKQMNEFSFKTENVQPNKQFIFELMSESVVKATASKSLQQFEEQCKGANGAKQFTISLKEKDAKTAAVINMTAEFMQHQFVGGRQMLNVSLGPLPQSSANQKPPGMTTNTNQKPPVTATNTNQKSPATPANATANQKPSTMSNNYESNYSNNNEKPQMSKTKLAIENYQPLTYDCFSFLDGCTFNKCEVFPAPFKTQFQ